MNYAGFVVFALVWLNRAGTTEVKQDGCTCAVFGAEPVSNEPLIEHSLPVNISCDAEGSDKCLQLCLALAVSAEEQAPSLICEKLNRHADNLKISVHSRVCSKEEWTFTGLALTEGICCHEGEATSCPDRPSQ